MRVLGHAFFVQKAPVVARALLGAYLVRRHRGSVRRYKIVETEAYDGFQDRASHVSRGRTARTGGMVGRARPWDVSFFYATP